MKTLVSYNRGKSWGEVPPQNTDRLIDQINNDYFRYIEHFGKNPREIILTQYAADRLGFEFGEVKVYGSFPIISEGMIFMGMRVKIESMDSSGIFRMQ